MQPKKQVTDSDLFRSRLDQILNMSRPLIVLSDAIDWTSFEDRFGSLYSEKKGRPGLPIRLMVGLTYLSRIYDLSDEMIVEMWLDNPYWQYFCGYEYFQHNFPLDPSSLVRWRKRIGNDGIEFLLEQTLLSAKSSGKLTKRHLDKVNVDTTVQEKAIRFPTDARLYHRMLERLVSEAKLSGIQLRQSYVRVSKRALRKHGGYTHASQMKRARKQTKKLKTMLGRVIRDIRRKQGEDPKLDMVQLLSLADRLMAQQRKDKNKLYSIHEPDVECISKGKAHKKYEFGCKVGIVTTSRDSWVIGAKAFHGNPYDGHTLKDSLKQMESLTGWIAKDAYVDLGYRGHGYEGETKINVVGRGRKRLTRSEKRWRKRRAAIEPIIGHLKSEHRLNRNMLKGKDGDQTNALLSGCGWNLRKLMQILLFAFFQMVRFLVSNRKREELPPRHYYLLPSFG